MGTLLQVAQVAHTTVLANSLTDWITREWVKVVLGAVISGAIAIFLWIGTTRVSLRIFRMGGVVWGISAKIDKQRQGIKLLIRNTGRTQGVVSSIKLVERTDQVYSKVDFAKYSSGVFTGLSVPPHSKAVLVINAKNNAEIPKRIRLHVHAGSGDAAVVKPKKMFRRRAIYMTEPVLPPGAIPAG
jgi:hypothetical protein